MNRPTHTISKSISENMPEPILDQACYWSVVLGDNNVSEQEKRGFDLWLQSHPLHAIVWQRLQLVEQELAPVRPLAQHGSGILQGLAKTRRQRKVAFASTLSVLLVVGFSLLHFPQWQADYVTGNGELQQISLDSGAIIYLDTSSSLDVETTPDGTLVHLYSGRILVDSSAASPTEKPKVITDQARFMPVGTRFVVTERAGHSELVVTQGQVQAEIDGNSRLVNAGDSVQVRGGAINLLAGNGMAPDAWVEGVIEANNARLGDVLDALSQHRRGWLGYDARTAELRVNGVFYLDDTNKALNSLANTLPISIHRTTNWWVRVKPK